MHLGVSGVWQQGCPSLIRRLSAVDWQAGMSGMQDRVFPFWQILFQLLCGQVEAWWQMLGFP